MLNKLTVLSFIIIYSLTSEVKGWSIIEQQSRKVTTFLQNLDTDASGLFSYIPFPKLHSLRKAILQPFIGFVGNTVESVSNKIDKRSLGKIDKVQFLLYSDKWNNESYRNLVPEDDFSIMSATFTKTRPIKILIHGFQASGFYEFPQKTKNAYLKFTDFNVIVVDWGPLSYPPINYVRFVLTYLSSINNLKFVARRTADLIAALHRNGIIKNPSEIHIVGFSLGSHVAGQVGYRIQKRMGSKLGRITALEPASPLLETSSMENRIDKTDATFVDALHTSHLAMYQPVGDADFYPNGGRQQNECFDGFNALQNPKQAFIDFTSLCSHEYGYELFTWSIENRHLIGCSCSSWANYRQHCKYECQVNAVMGEFCPTTARGIYFLETELPDGFSVNTFDTS